MDLVCRTCLSSSVEFESVFVKKLVNAEYTSVATMISACIGLEVSEYDSISCVVCKDCIDFIVLAFNYRKRCWKSHMTLMTQLKEHQEATKIQELKPILIKESPSDSELSDLDQWFKLDNTSVDLSDKPPNVLPTRRKRRIARPIGPKNLPPCRRVKYDENGLPLGYGDMLKYLEIVVDETGQNKMFQCIFCKFNYHRIGPLRAHQEKIHHLQFKNNFTCNVCGKLFVSEKRLHFHVRVHSENQFVCQFCGKKFRLNSALTIHVRRHTGDKPFGCDQCDYRAITKSDLATHKRSHTGEKPFQCYHCTKSFSTFSHRASHVRKHSDERPFKCLICKTAYKSRGVYRSHMDSHDPKKSIVCEVCKHVSSNRKNYMRHIKLHINKTSS